VFPQLKKVVNDYDIKLVKIDVDSQLEIAGQFLAFVMPTILIIHEEKEILREARFIDFNRIEKILEQVSN
jgi:thioredoxin-like negative regulator of GroEL